MHGQWGRAGQWTELRKGECVASRRSADDVDVVMRRRVGGVAVAVTKCEMRS